MVPHDTIRRDASFGEANSGLSRRFDAPMGETPGAEDSVVVEARGNVRVVTLNRPRQLNALTLDVVQRLSSLWAAYEADATVMCVVLRGSGRAFCAGGDVRAVHAMRPPVGDPRRSAAPLDALEFFNLEYQMNRLLHDMTTPHVALMDGVVMGGGCGVSVNGRFRVATERTVLAMPECAIGLVPDVGGTHFLSELPGASGTCLALTGRQVSGTDAKALGLATHIVSSGDLDMAVDALAQSLAGVGDRNEAVRVVSACLSRFERVGDALKVTDLAPNLALLDQWFAADTVENIVEALSASATGADDVSERRLASECLASIQAASPTSLKVTLAALRRVAPTTSVNRPLPLTECLRTELCMVAACLAREDFYEGVRARLIDKGKGPPPRWEPGEIAGVSAREVEAFFEPETREVEAVVGRFEVAVGLMLGRKRVGGASPRL